VVNLPPVCGIIATSGLVAKFATIDTGGKFATNVVDTASAS
jgi:hypothetical protein